MYLEKPKRPQFGMEGYSIGYWPEGGLFGVMEKPGISYTWRNIIRGVRALEQGLIWRVGDGSLINMG